MAGLENATIDVESHGRMVPAAGSPEERAEMQQREKAAEGEETDADAQPAVHNAL